MTLAPIAFFILIVFVKLIFCENLLVHEADSDSDISPSHHISELPKLPKLIHRTRIYDENATI